MRHLSRLTLVSGSILAVLITHPARALNCTEISQRRLTFTITTQEDANVLKDDCVDPANPGLNSGLNVIVSPAARGTINIMTSPLFHGDLVVEHAPLLEKLTVVDRSIAYRGFTYVTVRNLSRLNTIEFHFDAWDRDTTTKPRMSVSLVDLPRLETVNFDYLIEASEVNLVNLPLWTNLAGANALYTWQPALGVTIQNVGLSSVDEFLASRNSKWTISDVPNVEKLTIPKFQDDQDVNFTGRGNASVVFGCTTCFKPTSFPNLDPNRYMGELGVSGLSSISRGSPQRPWSPLPGLEQNGTEKINIKSFHAVNNTFRQLDLDFDSLSRLFVQNNTNLESILFHSKAYNYSWDEIVFAGNPNLRLKSALWPGKDMEPPDLAERSTTFFWPQRNTSVMVYDGAFGNDFFQPFVDLHEDVTSAGNDRSTRPCVVKMFVVMSSLAPDQFNCTQLDGLWRKGVISGEYSCQGHSAQPNGVGKRLKSSLGLLLGGLSIVWCLQGPFGIEF